MMKRRVAVVGAGPIGVSTAKFLVGEGCFKRVDVYEQQSSFGGAWIHSQPEGEDKSAVPQTNPYGPLDKIKYKETGSTKCPIVMTPMYDKLETNIPHTLMSFSDKGFPSDVSLFPFRTTVLKYIEDYGQEIKHLVSFGHQVTRLRLIRDVCGSDMWNLTCKDLQSGQVKDEVYDAVAIANGHYYHTSIPDTKGIREWDVAYPGSIRHSKYYRQPDEFAGKKVVVVGNASSGIDIGSQIAGTCQKPIIMSARSEPVFKMPSYADHVNVPELVEFVDPKQENRAVKFADGSVEENVDVVLFCTGYFLSFPFLEREIQEDLINSGQMVHGLYQYMFWIPHPSLAFLGLPNRILPMPLGEAQASVLSRVWSGRLSLPSSPQMRIWEHQRWLRAAEFLKAKGKPCEPQDIEKAFLTMAPGQDMEYHNDMVHWAGQAKPGAGRTLPRIWDERGKWIRSQMATIRKAYADLGDKKYDVRTIEDIGFNFEKWVAEQEENNRVTASNGCNK